MKGIRPNAITDAMIVANNATTPQAPWNSGTTYSTAGTVVSFGRNLYQSTAAASNLNKQPDLFLVGPGTIFWVDLGASNKWAMFDDEVSTVTTATGSLSFELKAGLVTSAALLNVSGVTVRLDVKNSSGTVVWTDTKQMLDNSESVDEWSWLFSPPKFRSEAVWDSIPPFADGSLVFTVTGFTGATQVYCGIVSVGQIFDSGWDQYGLTVSYIDYSTIKIDEFGRTTVVRRGVVKTMEVDCDIDTYRVDGVMKAFASMLSLPIVWIAANGDYDIAIIYGTVSVTEKFQYWQTSLISASVKGWI